MRRRILILAENVRVENTSQTDLQLDRSILVEAPGEDVPAYRARWSFFQWSKCQGKGGGSRRRTLQREEGRVSTSASRCLTQEEGQTVVGDGVDHLDDKLPASHSVRPSARPIVRVLEEQAGVLRVESHDQFEESRTSDR